VSSNLTVSARQINNLVNLRRRAPHDA